VGVLHPPCGGALSWVGMSGWVGLVPIWLPEKPSIGEKVHGYPTDANIINFMVVRILFNDFLIIIVDLPYMRSLIPHSGTTSWTPHLQELVTPTNKWFISPQYPIHEWAILRSKMNRYVLKPKLPKEYIGFPAATIILESFINSYHILLFLSGSTIDIISTTILRMLEVGESDIFRAKVGESLLESYWRAPYFYCSAPNLYHNYRWFHC